MAISKHLWIHGEGDGDDINTWKATDPDEDDDRKSRTQADGDDEPDDKNTQFKWVFSY